MIPYNKPYITGKELHNIAETHVRGHMAGDGHFTHLCNAWLEKHIGCGKALLTHSCTAALEIAMMVAQIGEGDEVIMPSYTFVSTANAVALRGGIPVFVDIRPDTLNIDETKIEAAITPRTKAIIPVHYAGVACEMDAIMALAETYNLLVIEDAAQGILSHYKGRPLGSIGHMAALSFHETKNIISGEGGALLINDRRFVEPAEIIREKGTNRSQFFRGQVDKYTWTSLGSSYLPGEIIAAFLWAQLEQADAITARRKALWQGYHDALRGLAGRGAFRQPAIPASCSHNAHIYYLLLPGLDVRTRFIDHMKNHGILTVFHYVPLHSSPAGQQYGRASGSMAHTDAIAESLVRLPLWIGLEEHMPGVIAAIEGFFKP
jgi:dTDP-4-amino-4,6-dideoxygalactose transaminase